MDMKKILIVDDEESIRDFLSIMLKKEGYEITLAEDGQVALDLLKKKSFDMIISDLQMPRVEGMELLKKVKAQCSDTAFLMITAFGTTETAIEAMKLGAYDYIMKPFKADEVRLIVNKALRSKSLEKENRNLRKELGKTFSFQNIIGNSEEMHKIFDMIQRVADMPTSIFITGESGTGKEVLAKAIHYGGSYKDKPFVPINCGAIPENLMESEMFGHKKGSFTGAMFDKKGMFEAAHGGTLFLDEIGEVSPTIQVKLLRALQERKIRPVGSVENIPVEVRVVAATNRDPQEMVKEGTLREDLYYRLNVINIHCPPLRERKEDIPLLVNHFLKKYNEAFGKNIVSVSQEAIQQLKLYSYPGNVRELENILERTVALEVGPTILKESLPPIVQTTKGARMVSAHDIEVTPEGLDLDKIIGQIEKEVIVKAIHQAGGVKKKAAKLLGISTRSMRYRVEKYGLGSMDEEDVA